MRPIFISLHLAPENGADTRRYTFDPAACEGRQRNLLAARRENQ